jgi:uncharacterized protein YoxC
MMLKDSQKIFTKTIETLSGSVDRNSQSVEELAHEVKELRTDVGELKASRIAKSPSHSR